MNHTARDVPDLAERPWMDAALDVERRVGLLLGVMTPAEKVGQTHQLANLDLERHADLLAAGGVGSTLAASGPLAGNVRDAGLGAEVSNALQRAAVETSRLGIPLLFARDVIHGHRTVAPIPLGQAATWDPGLVEAAARVAAREASADGVRWTFAPMLDIGTDPRWGRVAESFGEDPVLTARLGTAAVHGFQTGDLTAVEAIAACAKHYVGYAMAAGGRDYGSVDVGPTTLRNLHLRPFEAVVRAGVATVMSAFNDLDGVPVTAHPGVLRRILKDEWGFDGLVVSDWNAVGELLEHGVAADLREAAALALPAGVDVDMVSEAYARHLRGLVDSGEVGADLLDDAVARVLRLKFRTGLFERPYTDAGRAAAVTLTAEHRQVARDCAAASLVLLRNTGILPLAPGLRVCLTGPFATAREELLGTWTLDGRGEDVVTIADALTALLGEDVVVDDARFTDLTLHLARAADVVVACVGEHPMRSGEANSVVSLDLPPGQEDWLRAVHAMGKPLVVVVLTGRPLTLTWAAEHAAALVVAWHPGVEAGPALAEVLTGVRAPRGRLPMSFPRATGQVPVHYNHRPTGRPLDPARDSHEGRYRDSSDLALFPFGFGLTYGDVRYGPTTVSTGAPGGVLTVSADLTCGDRRTVTEVVQLYVHDLVAAVSRPVRELVDFRLVTLAPGARERVGFTVRPDQLGYVDATGRHRVDPGSFEFWVAPHAAGGTGVTVDLTSQEI